MAGDGITFSTTVAQYAKEHNITTEQAIKALGLPADANQNQFFTFEAIPEGGYRTVDSKMDTFKRANGPRTQQLETDQFPENNKTYRLNQHIKNFKQADGFLDKAKVAVVDVFFGDWENIGGFIDGAFLK